LPIFKNRMALEVVQGVTAFLNLDAGWVRGEAPNPDVAQVQAERLKQVEQANAEELKRAWTRIEAQEEAFRRAQRQLENKDKRIARLEKHDASRLETSASSFSAENIVWVFGTIRTGSTWLGSMMGDLKGHSMWNEPRVGELFGHFFYERSAHRTENKNFIMGFDRKPTWLKSIRAFVLDSVAEKYPKAIRRNGYLIVKEPSGSVGAPLLVEALPESRLIVLIRDPRDMVASALDAAKEGSWAHQLKGNRKRREAMAEDTDSQTLNKTGDLSNGFARPPDKIVEEQAKMYLRDVGNSKEAYETHQGPKVLVRYEELRANTLATMKRIYSELNIEVDEEELQRAVQKHSWENIPEEEKGEGKFHRKAIPGGWREDLSAEQVGIVEEITAPLLKEFYPG
jgi:hypothetical protein